MALIAIFIAVVGICVLAAFYGVDSRPAEHGRHRPNLY